MKYLFSAAALVFALMSCNASDGKNQKENTIISSSESVQSDSLAIVKLGEDLKKLKPLSPEEFKAKFKSELNGFTLTEIDAFVSDDSEAYCTANYKKGDANVYLMITDGAGVGASTIVDGLVNFLELKKIEESGSKTNIKPYKGHEAYFDYSMYESDGMTSIQYLEAGRYLVVASGNAITIDELKSVLDKLSL